MRSTASTADPDIDIVELARAGDVAQASARLMQRHGAGVYRYCCATLRDATLADDVQQQIFIEALRDLPRFARRSTIRIWLFGIARHRALDAAKRRRRALRRHAGEIAAEAPDLRASPAESLDDARLRAALIAGLEQLPENVRTVLLLRYQQGFTYAEIAAICGERETTLNARVLRALPTLREYIEARIGPLR